MVTREYLAALSDVDLFEFIGVWEDPDSGYALDLEGKALLDCELLRRPQFFLDPALIMADWEECDIPPSVPELRALIAEAKSQLHPSEIISTQERFDRFVDQLATSLRRSGSIVEVIEDE
jgi:hypothetical protein